MFFLTSVHVPSCFYASADAWAVRLLSEYLRLAEANGSITD